MARERHRARWFMGAGVWKGRRMPWQIPRRWRTGRAPGDGSDTVPEPIARLAYEEYANQGHGGQSFERIHERGGFGVTEVVNLLADLIERERETTDGTT